jgi:hypothetical protein
MGTIFQERRYNRMRYQSPALHEAVAHSVWGVVAAIKSGSAKLFERVLAREATDDDLPSSLSRYPPCSGIIASGPEFLGG